MLWTVSNPDPRRVAVVCHPHPLFGGTMHNKVVFQIAKTLHQLEIPLLFNFRGAGLSEGKHDKGRGEAGDVRAALDYLAKEFAAKPILWLASVLVCVRGLACGMRGGPSAFAKKMAINFFAHSTFAFTYC